LVEFSYNNGYQAYLKMSPFEALYGRKCNTLVSWDNPINRTKLEMLKDMEKEVKKIKKNLKMSQDRNFFYADRNITNKEFKFGENVKYLKVKPQK